MAPITSLSYQNKHTFVFFPNSRVPFKEGGGAEERVGEF